MDEGEAVVSHVISAALGGRGRAWEGRGGGRGTPLGTASEESEYLYLYDIAQSFNSEIYRVHNAAGIVATCVLRPFPD